jgi:hypothetical protein
MGKKDFFYKWSPEEMASLLSGHTCVILGFLQVKT